MAARRWRGVSRRSTALAAAAAPVRCRSGGLGGHQQLHLHALNACHSLHGRCGARAGAARTSGPQPRVRCAQVRCARRALRAGVLWTGALRAGALRAGCAARGVRCARKLAGSAASCGGVLRTLCVRCARPDNSICLLVCMALRLWGLCGCLINFYFRKKMRASSSPPKPPTVPSIYRFQGQK